MAAPDYLNKEKDIQTAEQALSGYLQRGGGFSTKLRDAIKQRLEYNKDLINEKNVAESRYFASPATAREKYKDVFDPYARENLVTQYRGQEKLPWANLQDLLTERGGRIEEMVGRGVEGFQTEMAGAQNTLRATQDSYNRALQKYQMQVAMASRGGGGGGRRSGGGGGGGKAPSLTASMKNEYMKYGIPLSVPYDQAVGYIQEMKAGNTSKMNDYYSAIETYNRPVDAESALRRRRANIVADVGQEGYDKLIETIHGFEPKLWQGVKFKPKEPSKWSKVGHKWKRK